MRKATTKRQPKAVHDSFRLRMVYGSWYIYLYSDEGTKEIKKEGPLSWHIANQQAANYRRDGLTDLDRLNDTEIR